MKCVYPDIINIAVNYHLLHVVLNGAMLHMLALNVQITLFGLYKAL